VKPPVFDYHRAASIDEALALIAQHGGDAKLLAGGQSLMPALNFRLTAPAALIDLNAIECLTGVKETGNGDLIAGAMTRHRYFETSPLIERHLPLLRHAMGSVAHVAIRNRGTLGGSLCHADPSAEWPALCLACDAQMGLQGRGGTRWLKADAFFVDLFTTALAPDELLAQVVFPAWPQGRRWGFQEVARRRGDFAIVGVVCVMDVDEGGVCTWACIVVFGIGGRPVSLHEAAAELTGRKPQPSHVLSAARCAQSAADCRTDHHASADYRRELVQALTARAIDQALGRESVHG